MSEKAKEARRQYLRNWRKNNKDKVREYNRRNQVDFWEKKSQGPKESLSDNTSKLKV